MWSFGDTDLSGDNPAADYPFLQGIEDLWPGVQAAAFADFQTQILPVAGGVELPTNGYTALRVDESITLTLDTNGLATGAPTPTPTCAAGATFATANYNDVTVQLRTTDEGSAVFTADCKIVIRLADGNATLFFVDALIASKESTISNWTHSFGSPSFGLHANRVFLDEIASGDRKWRGEGVVDDWDGDGVPNPYDWTPIVSVNLTLGDPDGSADNPWPIYNVWQLQAISSISVSTEGAVTGKVTLFGDGDNLTAHYRLAADVDATPTRRWNSGNGFTPLGGVFVGSLDGEGREIRGLYANLLRKMAVCFIRLEMEVECRAWACRMWKFAAPASSAGVSPPWRMRSAAMCRWCGLRAISSPMTISLSPAVW